MRYLAFLLVALAGCAAVPTPDGDLHITIAADRVAQCKEQGGCALFSQAEIIQLLGEAIEEGAKAAMSELDSHGCRKGAT
jgi:hypothetical protein